MSLKKPPKKIHDYIFKSLKIRARNLSHQARRINDLDRRAQKRGDINTHESCKMFIDHIKKQREILRMDYFRKIEAGSNSRYNIPELRKED